MKCNHGVEEVECVVAYCELNGLRDATATFYEFLIAENKYEYAAKLRDLLGGVPERVKREDR